MDEAQISRLIGEWTSIRPSDVPGFSVWPFAPVIKNVQSSDRGKLIDVQIAQRGDATCDCCLMFWFLDTGAEQRLESVILSFRHADAAVAAARAERLWNAIRGARGRGLAINVAGLRDPRGRYHDVIPFRHNERNVVAGDITIFHEDDASFTVTIAVSRHSVQEYPGIDG